MSRRRGNNSEDVSVGVHGNGNGNGNGLSNHDQSSNGSAQTRTKETSGINGDAKSTSSGTASPATTMAVGPVVASIFDYTLMVSLVFGGCCTNVWAYERLLKMESRVGSFLTFAQMTFITLQQLPSFLTLSPSPSSKTSLPLPRLKPRQVPLHQWALQVIVFAAGSLLNNLVYAYNVPLTVQIVFRSAGLGVSMLFGRFFMKKQYSLWQVIAVSLVSIGVVLATLSRPTSSKSKSSNSDPITDAEENIPQYFIGIAMLTASLVCTGILGLLQERTYKKYGPCWREGVFYTHALSLPMFLFFIPQIKHGLHSLNTYGLPKSPDLPLVPSLVAEWIPVPLPYIILSANLLSQLVCVSGVNLLSSRVSSVSTQVVLTTRKAISLCFSVWWFGNGWNVQLGLGALMVFVGSFWYTVVASPPPPPSTSPPPPRAAPSVKRTTEEEGEAKEGANGRSTALEDGDGDGARERERKEARKTRRSRPMQRVEREDLQSNAGDRKER